MDITPLVSAGHHVIQGYGSGFFRINGAYYEEAVIVMPEKVLRWPYEGNAPDLSLDALGALDSYWQQLDILLLGCGPAMQRVDKTLHEDMRTHNVSLDVMDTPAACRTYNVLMAEGRRVATALILP